MKQSDRSRAIGEDRIRAIIVRRGIPVFNNRDIKKHVGTMPEVHAIAQARYPKIDTPRGRLDYRVVINQLKIRVEVKNQDTYGTVCEKYPTSVMQCITMEPGEISILILEGKGIPPYTKELCVDVATDYRLGRGCRSHGTPREVYVMSAVEFDSWLKSKLPAR